ncbi:MAG TPA: ADYC domain-containing protein [Stenomitos sp.]
MQKTVRWWMGSSVVAILIAGVAYFAHQHQRAPEPSASFPTSASVTLKGNAVQGAVLRSTDSEGRSVKLKIQAVERDSKDPQGEIYLYTVVYQNNLNPQWQNLCQPDRDHRVTAIPLSGQWDSSGNHMDNERMTFACTNSALAKCVRWGYKPWKTVQGQSLRDYHQACSRMVRADYCGTGFAHTRDGTEIDIYDRLRIQKRTPHSGMKFEAAWSPDGAVAISRTRFPETLALVKRDCPERLKYVQGKAKSSNLLSSLEHDAPKALIFNDSFVKVSQASK